MSVLKAAKETLRTYDAWLEDADDQGEALFDAMAELEIAIKSHDNKIEENKARKENNERYTG